MTLPEQSRHRMILEDLKVTTDAYFNRPSEAYHFLVRQLIDDLEELVEAALEQSDTIK